MPSSSLAKSVSSINTSGLEGSNPRISKVKLLKGRDSRCVIRGPDSPYHTSASLSVGTSSTKSHRVAKDQGTLFLALGRVVGSLTVFPQVDRRREGLQKQRNL